MYFLPAILCLVPALSKAKGTYEYRGELVKAAGATCSELMIINVTK